MRVWNSTLESKFHKTTGERYTMNSDIQQRVKNVMERIDKIACEADKNPNNITLIAVTKTVREDMILAAINAGIKDIGENRVQEFRKKHNNIPKEINRHFIGTLQSNKVKYIIDKVDLIHSLDRLSLAQEINKRASAIGREIPVLIQVNVSREPTKSGLMEEELLQFIEKIMSYKHIRVEGLMTIAPVACNPEDVRPYFRRLAELFHEVKIRNYPNVEMKYLSMGMTDDYEIAIQEGANMVRIGRAIFGER